MSSLTVKIDLANWTLWPVWVAHRYSQIRRINLGPLVIQWYVPL